jgi:hypothetical protein
LRIVGFITTIRISIASGSALFGAGNFSRLIRMIEKRVDCVVLNTRIIDVDRLTALEADCTRYSISLRACTLP